MLYRHATRSVLVAIFALVLLILTGCDTVGPEESVVLQKDVTFRFEFSTNEPGEAVTATSTTTVNLDDVLFDEGYTRGDVILANLRSVEVERVSPPETNLDVFERLELRLAGSGPVIAQSNDPPSSRTAQLQIEVPGITQTVTAPSFGASLTAVPTIEEQFVLTATLDMRIEVEGI